MQTRLPAAAVSALVLWLASVQCQSAPVATNSLDAAVNQLRLPGTTLKDVTVLLGEPEKYAWGRRTFARDKLPDPVILHYTNGLEVVVSGGRVDELRCHADGEGFSWKGLRLGSTLEQVLAVVGHPAQIIEGRDVNYGRGVLYKDINRKIGECYFHPEGEPVRFFFSDYQVTGLYLAADQPENTAADAAAMPQFQTHLSPTGTVTIVRRPPPAEFRRGALAALPAYNARTQTPWQVDLRGHDLSGLDLTSRLSDLLHASFDNKTRWPNKLPAGFDVARIMDLGKDPGLGVRELHRQGITGKGVGIGIIDQTLLVGHAEYRDRLRLYEEIHNGGDEAQMHGPAVASAAVGKTVGVAPEADLYYIAETHGTFTRNGEFDWDFTHVGVSIDRLLQVNAGLPSEKRIRVISISAGWRPQQRGYDEVMAAVERADKAGIFVISTALERTAGLAFHGLGREPLADPKAFSSYGPGAFWEQAFRNGTHRFDPGERLLAPMDARCLASPTGEEDFVFYSEGGWSWAVPWIAGLYALACQVKPDISPEEFWREALKTGETVTLQIENENVPFGTIANPAALIRMLQPSRPAQ